MQPDAPTVDFRSLLEQEKAQLASELEELGEGEPGRGGLSYDSNFADTSQVTAERGEVGALTAKLRESLAEVERALAKLDNGTYGICEGCGEAIPEARLEAKPACARCMSCAGQKK